MNLEEENYFNRKFAFPAKKCGFLEILSYLYGIKRLKLIKIKIKGYVK